MNPVSSYTKGKHKPLLCHLSKLQSFQQVCIIGVSIFTTQHELLYRSFNHSNSYCERDLIQTGTCEMNYTRNSNYLSSWAGRAHTFLAGRYFLSNSQLPQDARFSAWQSLACLFTGRLTSRRAAGLGTTSLLEGEDRAAAGSQHVSMLFPARRWAACVVPKSAASCASLSPFALCVNYIPAKCYNVCSLICFLTGEGGEAHKEITKLRGESIGGKSCFWASTLHTRGRHGRKHSHSLCWCPACPWVQFLDTFPPEKKEGYPFSLQSALRIMQAHAPVDVPAMEDQLDTPSGTVTIRQLPSSTLPCAAHDAFSPLLLGCRQRQGLSPGGYKWPDTAGATQGSRHVGGTCSTETTAQSISNKMTVRAQHCTDTRVSTLLKLTYYYITTQSTGLQLSGVQWTVVADGCIMVLLQHQQFSKVLLIILRERKDTEKIPMWMF